MAATATEADSWIRRFHPAPEANRRLVCFPHAGGSASYYFGVARALAPSVDVLAVQYPGRQDRRTEPLVDDLGTLADASADVLAGWTDQPLAFFGHSMGATLAFEVARRLETRGTILSGLFVSGRRAPSTVRDERQHLGTDAQLIDEIKSLGAAESRLLDDPEIVRMVLPSIRNDYKAAETYRYATGPRLNCPIFALTGDADPKATIAEVRAWGEHTNGEFELTDFPGGHFFLNEHTSKIIDLITSRLLR
jgi:pyochelin biosynthetic protein PchC